MKALRAKDPGMVHTELRKEVCRLVFPFPPLMINCQWKEKKDAVPDGEEMSDISSDDLTDDDAPADED